MRITAWMIALFLAISSMVPPANAQDKPGVSAAVSTSVPALASVSAAAPIAKSALSPLLGKNTLAPDIKAAALWDGRKVVDFRALDRPKMVKAARATFLSDDEYVLGLTVNGQSRAYPTRFAAWHHIINDKVGRAGVEAFVTVTY